MNTNAFSILDQNELGIKLTKSREEQFAPSLAIAFCSPNFPFESAIQTFNEQGIPLIGCTTAGEIVNDSLKEQSMSVLLTDLSPDFFRIAQFEHQDSRTLSSGTKLARVVQNTFENPGLLVFISGVGVSADGVVEGFKEELAKEVPVYGAFAGDDLQQRNTYTFTHEGTCRSGVAALILDTQKVQMNGLAVSGWEPLGKVHTVTHSKDNIIYEIDNQPALDLFINYFGDIQYQFDETVSARTIPGQYPLKIQRPDGSSFLRSLIIYDQENRALIAAGEVPSGVHFEFCPTPELSVVEKTIQTFEKYGLTQPQVDASIMISCKGRHTSFGPFLEDEIKAVYDIWKAPMVGILAYGEIGNTQPGSPCEFQNVTCSLVNLTEI